jgi:hypothetical protein
MSDILFNIGPYHISQTERFPPRILLFSFSIMMVKTIEFHLFDCQDDHNSDDILSMKSDFGYVCENIMAIMAKKFDK